MIVINGTLTIVYVSDEFDIVHDASEHIRSVCDASQRWSDGLVVVGYFARPIHTWMKDLMSVNSPSTTGDMPNMDNTGTLIEALLLGMQALLPISAAAEAEPTADLFVRENTHLVTRLTSALNLDGILVHTRGVLASMGQCSAEDVHRRAQRVLPFLSQYLDLARHHLLSVTNWTAALFKLEYIICSIASTLAREGFCQPPDSEESGDGGDGMELQADGTGLGEGSGAENVSKEIQDESQVEGLQGEDEGVDEEVERAEEGNALEMNEEIGGQMQDVPDGDDEDEEGDDESNTEPEEQIGDLDASDPSAVDEKLWGDESGPQDDEKDGGKSKDDHSHQQQDSEMVAKDETGASGEKKQKDSAQRDEDTAAHDEESAPPDAELDGVDGLNEEDQEDQAAENGQEGAPIDEHIEEAHTLDLPDDVDLDAGKDEAEPMDDDLSLDDEVEQDDMSLHADDEPAEDSYANDVEDQHPSDDKNQVVEDAVDEDVSMDERGEGATAKADLHGDGDDSGQGQGASGDAADEPMDIDGLSGNDDENPVEQSTGRPQSSADAAKDRTADENSMQV